MYYHVFRDILWKFPKFSIVVVFKIIHWYPFFHIVRRKSCIWGLVVDSPIWFWLLKLNLPPTQQEWWKINNLVNVRDNYIAPKLIQLQIIHDVEEKLSRRISSITVIKFSLCGSSKLAYLATSIPYLICKIHVLYFIDLFFRYL